MTATALLCGSASAQEKSIVVASTTSTQDSGLFGYLLPIVKQKTGIEVKVLAQGTGQALDTARRCDADVVFVHAKSAEEKFLAEGFGVKRYPVMYNDFILIGPKDDPAGIKGKDILTALQTIKAKAAPFISRGDRSGTNIAELALVERGGHRHRERQRPLVQGNRPRHGRRIEHGVSVQRLCAVRSRDLACVSRIAATLSSLSKATSASLINTASCW